MSTAPERTDLEYAQAALKVVLDRAKQARPNARSRDLTMVEVPVDAPYAKEWRLMLGLVAQQHNVFAVGTVRGSVRGGYTVSLYGFKPDITKALEAWAHIRAQAEAGMAKATPQPGEDVATFRCSWLLGFRLGLTDFDPGDDVDERAVIEGVIAARVVSTSRDVRARSTGSGAWDGFRAARAPGQAADAA